MPRPQQDNATLWTALTPLVFPFSNCLCARERRPQCHRPVLRAPHHHPDRPLSSQKHAISPGRQPGRISSYGFSVVLACPTSLPTSLRSGSSGWHRSAVAPGNRAILQTGHDGLQVHASSRHGDVAARCEDKKNFHANFNHEISVKVTIQRLEQVQTE